MQYLAHWDVELHPNASDFPDDPDENCKHNITRVDAVLPTCEKEGRKAYYQCSVCGKKFTDISGQSEVSEEDEAFVLGMLKGNSFVPDDKAALEKTTGVITPDLKKDEKALTEAFSPLSSCCSCSG